MLEKNRLVTVMGQIYSGAEHVIVWLGRSRQLGAFLRFLNVLHAYGIETLEERTDLWRKQRLEVKRGCRQFFTNPYWQRAWITQEITLATSLKILAYRTEIQPFQMSSMRPFISFLYDETVSTHTYPLRLRN
jgi:hypothetical protein